MTISLIDEALTTLEAVGDEVGYTPGGADDDYLKRQINFVSELFANSCNRLFGKQDVTDEKHEGYGTPKLFVKLYPLLSIDEITYDDGEIDSDGYEIYDNGSSGAIFRLGANWTWTAAASGDIAHDPLPGTERQRYLVSYTGGYVLPKDDAAPPDQRTLPYDIEAIVIQMVAQAYNRRGDDRTVSEEKLMSATLKYGNMSSNGLTPEWELVIAKYARPVIA